jgi:hypothetical protein
MAKLIVRNAEQVPDEERELIDDWEIGATKAGYMQTPVPPNGPVDLPDAELYHYGPGLWGGGDHQFLDREKEMPDTKRLYRGGEQGMPNEKGYDDFKSMRQDEQGASLQEPIPLLGTAKAVKDVLTALFITPAEAGFKITPGIVAKALGASAEAGADAAPVAGKAVVGELAAKGLTHPESETGARLKTLAKENRKVTGDPKNVRTVLEPPKDKPELPPMAIGDIQPEDWIQRTETMLSPKEIQESAEWYDQVRGEFLKHTDGDGELADRYMMAWLVGQQNVSPEGSMNNVLLQAEQLRRGVPAEEMRAGGMPMPTKAIRNVLKGEPVEMGVGVKISDFVDSALGKSVRSWMANQPEGGAPFTVDVHSARDTGMVDDILVNHLTRLGYDTEQLAKLEIDFSGSGVPRNLYENRANFGRKLTQHLNDIKWQGRSDWKPREIQAIGWMAMTKLTGGESSGSSASALDQSLRRISFEVAPGEGSPWAKQYSEKFDALEPAEKGRITEVITSRALEKASEIAGIDVRSIVHGTGGWQKFQNPAAVGQALATREGAEIAANVLGLLLNQTEVWVNSIKGMTANPKAFAIDFLETGSKNLESDEELAKLWDTIMAADPTGLIVGFQSISHVDGRIGIRVLVDKGGKARIKALQEAVEGPITEAVNGLQYDVRVRGYEADLTKARNDWTKDSDGQAYLGRLADLGVRRTPADWDRLRQELTQALEGELGGGGKAAPKSGGKAKGKGKIKGAPEGP